MAEDRSVIRFFGDLSDSWVVAIADALPSQATREDRPDDLPIELPTRSIAIVHRGTLGPGDSDVMAGWRKAGSRVILCIGPHVRARDLERANASADVVLNEATAAETITRHLVANELRDAPARRDLLPLVAVVSQASETRRMLVDSCIRVGFPAREFTTWDDATPSRLAIWDAPVLEANWQDAITEPAKRRAIVALIGFADRGLVADAKRSGAQACLDFPCELADLSIVLNRLADQTAEKSIGDPAHQVPPAPKGLRVVRPPVVDPRRRR